MTIGSGDLFKTGELHQRAKQAKTILETCDLCPKNCGINRLEGEHGICATGRYAKTASYGAHFGEEQPISGKNGSGTIFFASCNLHCCFCQNYELSHFPDNYAETAPDHLAAIMLELQRQSCHNINLVSPGHVVPQILEALVIALEQGLKLPIVYNSSGYESKKTLALLDGVIDIYMPDFKFWMAESSRKYCNTEEYPDIAKAALSAMHDQVGELTVNEHGIAVRGLLVRHLVMPGGLQETKNILDYIATAISPRTYVNIMDQYRPCGSCDQHRELRQPLDAKDYREALLFAEQAGLERLDQADVKTLLAKLGII
jgi:putative pyruvate formate lyase activating enzyme